MQNYFLKWKERFVVYNSGSVLGAGWLWWGLGLERTTLKQCLFLTVGRNAWLWRHLWVSWFHMYNYCQANNSCMIMDHGDPQGLLLYTAPWSCYNVSPNHTHKQDTITDMQCGCPFVWFMGDVVANVASVSFRGSGKLQIFPSQQEVQTWKKGRETEGWWEAGRSWKEARIFGRNGLPHSKTEMTIICSTKEVPTLHLRKWDEISSGSNVVNVKTPWIKLQGTRVLFFTSHWVVITWFYNLPRSQLFHLWNGDYNTLPSQRNSFWLLEEAVQRVNFHLPNFHRVSEVETTQLNYLLSLELSI